MVWLILFFPILNLPTNEGVRVKIDGTIDLGPKWNFEYKIAPDLRTQLNRAKPLHQEHVSKRKKKHHSMRESSKNVKIVDNETDKIGSYDNIANFAAIANIQPVLVNKTHQLRIMPINDAQTKRKVYKVTRNPKSGIYDREHRVKEDFRIKEFTVHLYKQAIRVFDRMEKKLKDGRKVHPLAESYKDKFTEFVNETQNQKIKTRLGTQKVILNTLDTSNRILKKLVNNLIAHTEDHTVLRQDQLGTASILTKEVDKEIQSEYDHVCLRYGLCRTGYGFTDFLADVLNTVLQYDDVKLKRATDSLTEAAKETDLGISDSHIRKKFIIGIERMERWDGVTLRFMLHTLKNVLVAKNQPLRINEGMNMKDINKTVALLEILNTLNEKIPANKVNTMEWKDITNSLEGYSMGGRHNIQDIMNALVDHIRRRGIKNFDRTTSKSYVEDMKIILKD